MSLIWLAFLLWSIQSSTVGKYNWIDQKRNDQYRMRTPDDATMTRTLYTFQEVVERCGICSEDM